MLRRSKYSPVSPKSWNLALSPRRTPAVTGPECSPKRMLSSPVSGPKVTSSSFVTLVIFREQSCAKRAMIKACFSCGSGSPATATSASRTRNASVRNELRTAAFARRDNFLTRISDCFNLEDSTFVRYGVKGMVHRLQQMKHLSRISR